MADTHYVVSADITQDELPYGIDTHYHVTCATKEEAAGKYIEMVLAEDPDWLQTNEPVRIGVVAHSYIEFFEADANPGYQLRKEKK